MPFVAPLVVAVLATALLVPVLARLAPRHGLLDMPGPRSTHTAPVARVGGLAILGGLGAALLVATAGGAWTGAAAWTPYLVPLLLYAVIGLADDRGAVGPALKFSLQATAAALAALLGLRWQGEGLAPFGALSFGDLTFVMTWLWIVAVVILVNFVDGIDLITACIAVVVLGAAGGAGAGPGGGLLYLLAAAATVGFAGWNLAPARAFPGDAGTHALGFLVATAALHVPGETVAMAWPAASAPLLPGVIDVGLGLLAKRRHGVAAWKAHNQHLHQRLTRVGWSHAAVAMRYGVLTLLAFVIVAVVGPRFGPWALAILSGAVLLVHLGTALGSTRRVPWEFGDGAAHPWKG